MKIDSRVSLTLAVTLLALGLAASGGAADLPPRAVHPPRAAAGPSSPVSACITTVTEVLRSSSNDLHQEEFLVIGKKKDWCDFWDRVFATTFPKPACDLTTIDFGKEVAVVAALGDRNNGCFGVDVTCIQRGHRPDLSILVTETQPNAFCLCTQVVVQPLVVVKVARPGKTAAFVKQTIVLNCTKPKP